MIQQAVSEKDIEFFKRKAAEKIKAERWKGRNIEQKTENFVNCWVTEEAFKQLLIKHKAFFRHRALYIGDAAGAGFDFEIKLNEKWVRLGIRSIGEDSLHKWKSVTYPEDRFLSEKEKIADYIVACYNDNGTVNFIGMIDKKTLIEELEKSERQKSYRNQEWFRKVPIEKFSENSLQKFLESIDGC